MLYYEYNKDLELVEFLCIKDGVAHSYKTKLEMKDMPGFVRWINTLL